MTTKSHRHFWIVLLAILVACGGQTTTLPTEAIHPTATASPTHLPTSTSIPTTVMPSPLPTQPTIPIITPDAIQVERWKEYQTELAKRLLSFLPPAEVLCEWEILGQSEQKVYVWAICEALGGGHGAGTSVVIHLDADGAIKSVEKTGSGSKRISNIRKMFPPDIQEIILNSLMNYRQLSDHLEWRQEHSAEPPLIVFSATPMP